MKKQSFFDKLVSGFADNVVDRILCFFIQEKATIVVPALNEEKTIAKVVNAATKSCFVNEIIVVDDGSTDKTAEKAKGFSQVKLFSHKRNMGKGQAIKTGIKNSSNDIIFFLDADLENISSAKISSLLRPLILKDADFVKAGFSLKRGRVTEIAVKPMMNILFPGYDFSQPISGQFGARKKFLSEISLIDRWGVDIAIFLDALKKGLRVLEVDIGELKHKARSTEEKAEMSKQVMETMLKRAGVFADYFHTIVFSESALFNASTPKKNSREVISRLKKRRYTVFLFGYCDTKELEKKAIAIGIESFFVAESNLQGLELLQVFKKFLKKFGLQIKQVVFVASEPTETILLNAVGYGIATGKDKALCNRANKVIDSLPELLLLDE